MGNQPITVGLRTDQSSYTAGDRLTGRVYVNVTKRAQSALSLQLQIRGEEHVVVHHTTSRSHGNRDGGGGGRHQSSEEEHHYEESHSAFLQVDYPLQNSFSNQQLPPGQYEYPFSIQLPANLPSTMKCHTGQSYCEVKYEVIATLIQPNSGIFHPNPDSKQYLSIYSSASASASASANTVTGRNNTQATTDDDDNNHDDDSSSSTFHHLPMEEIPVVKCCCRRKGTILLESQMTPTMVQPNDRIQVEFKGQNQSTLKILYVRVHLQQIVEWNVHNHQKRVQQTLFQQDLDAAQFPELAKLQKKKQRQRHHQQQEYFGAPPSAGSEQSPFSNSTWHTAAQVAIPPRACDSYYHGRSLQVRHVLSIQLITKGCCATNPDQSTRIQIYRHVPRRQRGPRTRRRQDNNASLLEDEHRHPSVALPSAPSADYDHDHGSSASPTAAAAAAHEVEPSAPSAFYDDYHGGYSDLDATVSASTIATTPLAEAHALPADWHAQTADMVDIPMAQAIILESSSDAISTGNGSKFT